MTGPTVTYRTSFRRAPESRLTVPPQTPAPFAAAGTVTSPTTATPIARLLALAHHVERLVEAGELKDYAEAARRLGMAKSHMTHVTNLLTLAPDIQEAMLFGQLSSAEHVLRSVCRHVSWFDQRQLAGRPRKCTRRRPLPASAAG